MPILFVGNRSTDFEVVNNVAATTFAAHVPPDMTDAMLFDATDAYLRTKLKAPAVNYWVSFYRYASTGHSSGSTGVYMGKQVLWPTSVNYKIALQFGRTFMRLQVNGVTVVNVGAPAAEQFLERFDMRVKLHATTGLIEVYQDGTLIMQWEGNTAVGLTEHDVIAIFGSDQPSNNAVYGAVIVSTGDSRIFTLAEMPIIGNGALQEWDGDYTDINDSPSDFNTFIETNTPNTRSTYLFDKPATPIGYQVGAVVISGPMNQYGDDVDSLQIIQYDGVTDVNVGTIPAPQVLFSGRQVIAEVDPTTGLRYTDADFLTYEYGFKAVKL
jgi:hypothetical protein